MQRQCDWQGWQPKPGSIGQARAERRRSKAALVQPGSRALPGDGQPWFDHAQLGSGRYSVGAGIKSGTLPEALRPEGWTPTTQATVARMKQREIRDDQAPHSRIPLRYIRATLGVQNPRGCDQGERIRKAV
jgi:hypothetical protein